MFGFYKAENEHYLLILGFYKAENEHFLLMLGIYKAENEHYLLMLGFKVEKVFQNPNCWTPVI